MSYHVDTTDLRTAQCEECGRVRVCLSVPRYEGSGKARDKSYRICTDCQSAFEQILDQYDADDAEELRHRQEEVFLQMIELNKEWLAKARSPEGRLERWKARAMKRANR